MTKKRRLGRGLDALISDDSKKDAAGFKNIELDKIEANPYQPREEFNQTELAELAESIKVNGVIQPIILTPNEEGYYLVAGERRWRAAKLAGLEEIPSIIQEMAPEKMMELALIENIHREDLNPLEESRAYQKLLDEFDLTQAELAERLGKSRSTITNSLRLLKVAKEVQAKLLEGSLSSGQARALAGLSSEKDQKEAMDKVLTEDMNVRQTEGLVAEIKSEKQNKKDNDTSDENGDILDELDLIDEIHDRANKKPKEKDLNSEIDTEAKKNIYNRELKSLAKRLTEITGLDTKASRVNGQNRLVIYSKDLKELERLIDNLT
ncbi:ParB/RepB/Spo0J family partition protein [Halanaerobiaceae bacterium Z-7014]|uniref:ParB/RepB/Spo0J family partition protein n=1 Tax=Halonatronomonas betaini TaxID=2778430 RepID=A0A931ATP0_9FIRM|nr:ParB/RepB/Spo0J family partition protein [Halonatronomonas betaini]MBF8437706.1 ParB/RepB/Spo0J family partition protein [Halonatronomonas betaini]